MAEIMKSLGTPLVIHQPRYNMFERWIENGLQDVLKEEGIGSISFCPLAQGLLTNKYINGIPARGGKLTSVLLGASKASQIIENVNSLNNLDFTQDELNAIEDALK